MKISLEKSLLQMTKDIRKPIAFFAYFQLLRSYLGDDDVQPAALTPSTMS